MLYVLLHIIVDIADALPRSVLSGNGIMARADPASFTSRHGLTKLLGGDRPVTIT